MAFKIRQNAFPASPEPHGGADDLPIPHSRLGGALGADDVSILTPSALETQRLELEHALDPPLSTSLFMNSLRYNDWLVLCVAVERIS